MPLDANLFVLTLNPRAGSPTTLDFREELKEDNLYTARKDGDKLVLLDPWTDDSLYGSLAVLGPKLRLVNLESPSALIECKSTGSLSWEWKFLYEHQTYRWERSSAGILGAERAFTLSVSMKPDPDFPVCIYSPPNKRRPATVQFLDYNLQRIEPNIEDKKGFEILTLLSLLSFLDNIFGSLAPAPTLNDVVLAPPNSRKNSAGLPVDAGLAALALGAPSEPPTPPRRASGNAAGPSDGSSSSLTGPKPLGGLSTNEIEVRDPTRKDEDCARCLKLLQDDSLLWIMLIGQSAQIVPHVVALAEVVKRQRYKASGEELKQFIDDDAGSVAPGAKCTKVRIEQVKEQFADSAQGIPKDATPSSIKIYLSRIELADLLPNYKPKTAPVKPPIRPPINFDIPAPGPSTSPSAAAAAEREKAARLRKPKEEGGGGGFLGFGRRGM